MCQGNTNKGEIKGQKLKASYFLSYGSFTRLDICFGFRLSQTLFSFQISSVVFISISCHVTKYSCQIMMKMNEDLLLDCVFKFKNCHFKDAFGIKCRWWKVLYTLLTPYITVIRWIPLPASTPWTYCLKAEPHPQVEKELSQSPVR